MLAVSSCPVAAGYVIQQSLQLTSIFIVGRLGSVELSIVAFSYMIATGTAWLLAIGGTTAIDPLGSMSFMKGGHIGEIGILLQKYLVSTGILFMPIAGFWYFSASFLLYFGHPAELAYGTQTFLRALTPFAIGYILFEALKKYLQCQEIRTPGTLILLVAAILNIPTSYLFVHTFGWGLTGGACATGSMYWLCALSALAYIRFSDASEAWCGWSSECLQDLWGFTKTVLLGIVSVGAEWWAFEIIALAAGSMGQSSASAQSIIMSTDSLLSLFPFGAGIATTNRVASLLGAGNVKQADIAARAASVIAASTGLVVMAGLLLFGRQIALLFTDDPNIVSLAVAVFPCVAAFQISDGLQAANAGVLRAVGKVNIAAVINMLAYYCIATPIGIFLAFKLGYGLYGLWAGLALALTLAGLAELAMVFSMNWSQFGQDCDLESLSP